MTDALTGFTKLFSHIVHSTVWREEMHVKVVWITMLALTDRHGQVSASIPGLADAAKVSIDQCEHALARLSSPDTYSRTKENEGRRIRECDGGWVILNHAKYRERKDEEQTRLMTAARVKAYRERKRESVTVTPRNAQSRKSNGIPDAEADTDTEERTTERKRQSVERVAPANPLVAGRRPALETECLRLVREIAEMEGKDAETIMREAQHYDGAKRSTLNPANMTDDRLLNTVLDLRATKATLDRRALKAKANP